MSRTHDKDCYYFSHDSNARNDDKIMMLRAVHGLEGYAIYFMLIEILREQPNYKLALTKYTYNALAMQMQCDVSRLEMIIKDCCEEFKTPESSLLKIEGGYLYSESLLRRMKRMDDVSESRSQSAKRRWQSKSNANVVQMLSNEKKRKENI